MFELGQWSLTKYPGVPYLESQDFGESTAEQINYHKIYIYINNITQTQHTRTKNSSKEHHAYLIFVDGDVFIVCLNRVGLSAHFIVGAH